jgi:hypothetical protein
MSCPAALHNDDATKIQDFSMINADRHLAGTFYFRHSYDVMVQIRTVKPGIRALKIESPVRAFNARRAQGSPHLWSASAEMFKARVGPDPQKSRFQIENQGEPSDAFGFAVPKKSQKSHFENEATTQRASLGTRRVENKMIGSRCPTGPNPTMLHVDPCTCMQLPHEASITARISGYESSHVLLHRNHRI